MKILSVTESIFHKLRDMIICGEKPPGQKLDEHLLSSSLSVSRPPLREAFRLLQNEHLIYTIPRKGTYVTDVSVNDFGELYQVRKMAECCAIEILQEKKIVDIPMNAPSLSGENENSISLRPTVSGELKWVWNLQNFHINLVKAAGNHRLNIFYQTIASSVARYTFICRDTPGMKEESQIEHQNILDLIGAGDYVIARQKLITHIDQYLNDLFLELIRKRISKYKAR